MKLQITILTTGLVLCMTFADSQQDIGTNSVPLTTDLAPAEQVEKQSTPGSFFDSDAAPLEHGKQPAQNNHADSGLLSVIFFASGSMFGMILTVMATHLRGVQTYQKHSPFEQSHNPTLPIEKVGQLDLPLQSQPTVNSLEILPPHQLLEELSLPESNHANAPWRIGSCCIKGNVRDNNQDYAVAFEIGDLQVGIIADGMGGLSHGKQASYIATKAATSQIIKDHATLLSGQMDVRRLMESAIMTASAQVQEKAAQYNIKSHQGLRTTLIIAIGTLCEWRIGYLGDGGAVILRENESQLQLLFPHRGEQQNIVHSSLGPAQEGSAIISWVPRKPQDLLILSSDGVWDRVEDDFAYDVLNAAKELNGNLSQTTESILSVLANHKDEQGYLCDDNMSLVCMSDGLPRTESNQPIKNHKGYLS